MKRFFFHFLLMLALGFASCEEVDPCEKVSCVQGGCQDGSCICNVGFEGEACDTEMRNKFVGSWEAAEICNSGSAIYAVEVQKGAGILEIHFFNLYQQADSVAGTVSGLDVDIPLQAFGIWTIEGSGQIDTVANPASLGLDFSLDFGGGGGQNCIVTLTKQ